MAYTEQHKCLIMDIAAEGQDVGRNWPLYCESKCLNIGTLQTTSGKSQLFLLFSFQNNQKSKSNLGFRNKSCGSVCLNKQQCSVTSHGTSWSQITADFKNIIAHVVLTCSLSLSLAAWELSRVCWALLGCDRQWRWGSPEHKDLEPHSLTS